MPRRDMHSNVKAVSHIIQTATATIEPSTGVDLAGFDAAEFVIHIGAVANIASSPQPSWSFKLQESDQAGAGFADVVNADDVLVGSARSPVVSPDPSTGVFLTVDDAAEDDQVYRVGYIGNKRYVRVVPTAANTPGNTPLSVVALLGKPDLAPTSDA